MLGELLSGAAEWVDTPAWLPILSNAAFKGALILTIAALARGFLRRSSAAVRHSVGALAVLALLALPVLSAFLPAWGVPVLSENPLRHIRASQPAAPAVSVEAAGGAGPSPRGLAGRAERWSARETERLEAARQSGPSRSDPQQSREARRAGSGFFADSSLAAYDQAAAPEAPPGPGSGWAATLPGHWPTLAVLLWMAVSAALLARLVYAMLAVYWVTSKAHPAEARWARLADSLRRRMGVRRRVRLVFSDHLEVGLSLGLWRPVIILPSAARHWSQSRLESIVLHEMGHVRRWDNLFNVLTQLAWAFHWFNPLMWWVAGRMTVDRERACDDAVLGAGTRPAQYAGHLLEVARAALPVERRHWRTLEVSQSSALKDRLSAILEKDRNRSPLAGHALAAVAAAALLVVPLAAFRPWADPPLKLAGAQPGEKASKRGAPQDSAPAPGQADPAFAPRPEPGQSLRGTHRRPPGFVAAPPQSEGAARGVRVVSAGRRSTLGPVAGEELAALAIDPEQLRPTGLAEAGPGLGFPSILLPGSGAASRRGSAPGSVGATGQPPARVDPDRPPRPGGDQPDNGESPADPPQDPQGEEPGMATVTDNSMSGPFGQGTDVNDGGTVVGIGTDQEGEFRPFVWDEIAGLQLLGTLGGESPRSFDYGINQWPDSASRAVAVNDRGEVVGISTDAQGRVRSFYWTESTGLIDMGSLGGGETRVKAINELGQAVGFSRDAQGRKRAFLWALGSGIADLGGPPDASSEANAINDLGQVAGIVDFRPFLWVPGQGMFRLGPETLVGEAEAINSAGWVVGWARFSRGSSGHAFLWTPENGIEDLGTLGAEFVSSRAVDINEEGVVIGSSSTAADPFLGTLTQRAFLWMRGQPMIDIDEYGGGSAQSPDLALNNARRVTSHLRQPHSGESQAYQWLEAHGTLMLGEDEERLFIASSPTALNDFGEIVGAALVTSQDPVYGEVYRPVLWRPKGLQRPATQGLEAVAGLEEELDDAGLSPESPLREAFQARLTAAARKLQTGQSRQAQIDIYRLAVLAERAHRQGLLDSRRGQQVVDCAVRVMHELGH